MERDPAELKAEFEAECRRVGVRFDDMLPPPEYRGSGGLAAIGFQLPKVLRCLRTLPDNAGTKAFLDCVSLPEMHRSSGHDIERPIWPTKTMSRDEYGDVPRALPTMREIESHEEYLLDFVTSLTGDAATRDRILERRGIYKEYAKIFTAYLDHVGDGVEGLEALRRVTFLLWCAATQPACLTGVDELSEAQEEMVVSWLDAACNDDTLDPQLRWMLGYYHGAYPDVFGRFTKARALQRVLARTFPESWRIAEPEARHFAGRGLMGHFWSQIVSDD